MDNSELELWWSSLTVAQKERVARKGLSKASPDKRVDTAQYSYPACSAWWKSLDAERKQSIHDHCADRHGYLMHEWNEADPYGD